MPSVSVLPPSAVKQRFVSFDGSTKVDSFEALPRDNAFFDKDNFEAGRAYISRGAGLSYTPASFARDAVSIDHAFLNSIIDFNEAEQCIEIDAGASLGQLYDFAIEKNLFLATQPGHPRISVGGCIAPDIHGKNQFLDGTFINQVRSLKLFHPAHGVIELSSVREPELFRLTCGAYGLTGNIISCKLNLKKVPSSNAMVTLKPLPSIEALPEQLRQSAAVADFVLSWHDFTLSGSDFGKGFVQEGKFIADESEMSRGRKSAAAQTLSAAARASFVLPVFNPITIKLMNMMYGARCGAAGASFKMSLFDSIFPIQNSKELYFKFFGAGGFHEYQVVVPESNFSQYVIGVKNFLAKNRIPITLASGKLFAGQQDLLRFSGNGICFALNFARSAESPKFLAYLDKLLLECGGIPNIIKDSRLPLEIVQSAYPEYDKFRRLLREFDPQRIYKSELSERLGL